MKELKIKLYTVQRYAEMKGVSRQTVYNWIREGRIQVKEISGVRFIHG